MQAVHWLRTRQEEYELSYWLSFVAYDQRDRSFNNRIYLLYIILFFSVWIFVVLTFFASAGSIILRLVNPLNPIRAALFLETLLLGVWSLVAFWFSLRRSPVVFSEQDEVLICQTPISRSFVTLRWILMPWVKSGILFWLAAIILGFSVAETSMPGVITANRILEYAGYGLRAWVVVIPVHLTLFALQWAVGILRLQKDKERQGLAWLVIPAALALFSFLWIFTFGADSAARMPWSQIVSGITYPVLAGFGQGNIFISLLTSGLFAIAALGVMVWSSRTFSLSRAAQETREVDTLEAASRYGFTDYARQLQDQRRLGVNRAPTRLPAFDGAGILIWKDLLQSQRSFHLSSAFIWVQLFLLLLGFAFLPDLGSRALVIGFWVIQLGQGSVIRLRGDLALWALTRQLPFALKDFLLFNQIPAYLLSLLISEAGLVMGSAIAKTPMDGMAILLPGIAASVAGLAAFDVIRQARSNMLIAGYVPEVSAAGIMLGLVATAIPLLIRSFIPGIIGLFLSTLMSLGIGVLAVNLAYRAYHHMDAS